MKSSTVITIVVVVLIAAGIWYWYAHRSQVAVAPSGETSSSTIVSTTTPVVEYRNATYGFALTLPENWQGYTVKNKQWAGQIYKNGKVTGTDKGPLISITAPTSTKIKQDIPIMVFTNAQWNLITAGTNASATTTFMSVSAAPVPPSEMGNNSKYVIAIPARYNYAFPAGWQMVDQIIQNKSNWSFFEPTP